MTRNLPRRLQVLEARLAAVVVKQDRSAADILWGDGVATLRRKVGTQSLSDPWNTLPIRAACPTHSWSLSNGGETSWPAKAAASS